jgi:hypothetical protein
MSHTSLLPPTNNTTSTFDSTLHYHLASSSCAKFPLWMNRLVKSFDNQLCLPLLRFRTLMRRIPQKRTRPKTSCPKSNKRRCSSSAPLPLAARCPFPKLTLIRTASDPQQSTLPSSANHIDEKEACEEHRTFTLFPKLQLDLQLKIWS